MTLKTLITTLLLAISFLLLTACDSKVETNATNEQNPTAQVDITSGDINPETGNSNEAANSGGDATESNNGTVTNDGTVTSGTNDDSTTTPTVALTSLKLTIEKNSLNKDENTTVKVMANYSDNTIKDVTEEVEWIVSKEKVIKVTKNILTALQDRQITLHAKLGSIFSEKISLDIYWEVNGYRLPYEPDSKVNNSTLLGIDVNGNGVRDDVERKIYFIYDKEIERKMLMQEAKLQQSRLADPDLIKNAVVWEKKGDKSLGCISYIYNTYDIDLYENTDFLSEATFTTKDRARKYMNYNYALSGGVYGMDNNLRVEDSCDFNVTKALKSDK